MAIGATVWQTKFRLAFAIHLLIYIRAWADTATNTQAAQSPARWQQYTSYMMVTIEKRVSETIRVIESFFSESFYEVASSHKTLNKAVAKTEKKEDGFFFEFTKMELTNQDERHQITYSNQVPLKFSNYASVINFNLSDCKYTFSVGLSGYTKVTGYIKEFTTNQLEKYKNSYYRAVIIRESDHALSGFFYHNNSLQIGTSTYGSGVLELTIKEINLHLFTYTSKETKRSYFIVESQNEVSYFDFLSIQDEIILSLTYLTGCFLGKSIYIGKSAQCDHPNPVEVDHPNPEQTDQANPVQTDHPLSCI